MKLLGRIALVALVGVVAIALVGGDPRGTRSMERSEQIALVGLLLCVCTTVIVWRTTRASAWWLVPTGIVTVMGALSGWIAGVELAGDTHTAVRLATAPGKVAFLVAMTVAGLVLPTAGLGALAQRLATRRDRAGT